ncbi:hypothetical protein EH31_02100 [Erythrobacter longus]|uniref:Mechanosensitive ion channel protein MscS n=1 Tax=Erythrobacter longus TaxID=1044 RepID=A0A074N0P2_ERYLO|nr:hypothetical protein [Erythrobacter longus]KEO91482.1 hypothetical protein EH31_02100 [Erythrobacter longus]
MFQTVFDQIDAMAQSAVASLPSLAIAAVILAITWMIAKSATKISARLIGKIDLRPSLRETHIRALSGELHVLPNSILFKAPLEVVTDLDEAGIEIPFPYITHTFKEAVPLGERQRKAA